MIYKNELTGDLQEYKPGDLVVYNGKYTGVVLNETDVRLDTGDIVKTLATHTHKFVNVTRPIIDKKKAK